MQLATSSSPFQLGAFEVVWLLVVVAIWLVTLLAYVRIVQKAGYSGWWVLIGLVPVANVVMFLVFAFGQWPVSRENAELRARTGIEPRRW
jgi:uncharacterized membrane protein YhaH (DUF805 family)